MLHKLLTVFRKDVEGGDESSSTASKLNPGMLDKPRSVTPPPEYSEKSTSFSGEKMPERRVPITSGHQTSLDDTPAYSLGRSGSKSLPAEQCVQLCPHEFLSFDRLQRILALPNFKQSNEGIDALGSRYIEQHVHAPLDPFRSCEPKESRGRVFSSGVVLRFLAESTKYGYRQKTPGMELRASYVLDLFWLKDSNNSKTFRQELKKNLEDSGIFLCPHRRMSDKWVIERVCLALRPKDTHIDPIDEWLVKEDLKRNLGPNRDICSECIATLRIRGRPDLLLIDVVRFLGEGKDPNDPIWLAQCMSKP